MNVCQIRAAASFAAISSESASVCSPVDMFFSAYRPAAISLSPTISVNRAAELVGQFHGALQLALGQFHRVAGAPQIARHHGGAPQRRLAQRRDEQIERRARPARLPRSSPAGLRRSKTRCPASEPSSPAIPPARRTARRPAPNSARPASRAPPRTSSACSNPARAPCRGRTSYSMPRSSRYRRTASKCARHGSHRQSRMRAASR